MTTTVNETGHLRDSDLVRYMDGEGRADERQRSRAHLGTCPSCQQRLGLLRGRSAALSRTLGQIEVPERKIVFPGVANDTAAAPSRGTSSGGRSGALLKAAVIVLLVGTPAIAMVPPARQWIATQWSQLTANPADPAEPGASATPNARSAVSFVPSDRSLNLWLEREPAPEMIRIVAAETERVTIETAGSGSDRLFVLPGEVRIANGSSANARYVITVPSTLEAVVVYVAGTEYLVFHPRDEAVDVRRESPDQPHPPDP